MTDKDRKFIYEYLKCRNPIQAYMVAFNVEKHEITDEHYRMLRRADINAEIKRLLNENVEQPSIDVVAKDYVNFLIKGAFADIGDFIEFQEVEEPKFNPDGSVMVNIDTGEPITTKRNKLRIKDSKYLDTGLIKSATNGKDGIKVELYDKLACWTKLQEYFNWASEANIENNLNTQILEAIKGKIEVNWKENEDEYKELHEALKKDE